MLANNLAKDIIHDFFLSSAITANAMRKLGAEGGCNRRFICVQLPELTDGKSEAYKAGYKSICKIGKERIHRAGVKIKKTSPLATNTVNTGFRVLRLDSSNRKIWDDSPLTNQNASTLFERRMLEYLGVLVRGRYEIEMTYDVVLKSG
jgi:adenine-specific DNA-methyltransferase